MSNLLPTSGSQHELQPASSPPRNGSTTGLGLELTQSSTSSQLSASRSTGSLTPRAGRATDTSSRSSVLYRSQTSRERHARTSPLSTRRTRSSRAEMSTDSSRETIARSASGTHGSELPSSEEVIRANIIENKDRRRVVRTVPIWAHSDHNDYNPTPAGHQHQSRATDAHGPADRSPYCPEQHTISSVAAGWRKFIHDSSPWWGQAAGDHSQAAESVVQKRPLLASSPLHTSPTTPTDSTFAYEPLPDLEKLMKQQEVAKQSESWYPNRAKRLKLYKRIENALMENILVPLIIRMVVLVFCVVALALATSIFRYSRVADCKSGSSTYMAIIVDASAIVYTFWVAYDESTGKALGLRSHRSKMRLLFLDLFFIVCQSANIALAFWYLTDKQWACHTGVYNQIAENHIEIDVDVCPFDADICSRQQGLTSVLMVSLVAWLSTFAISTLRIITNAVHT